MASLKRRILACSALFCTGLALYAQGAADPRLEPATETAEVSKPATSLLRASNHAPFTERAPLKITPGDLIVVGVDGVSDYKPEVRVSESGAVFLPLIGEVNIAGLTVEQARGEIAKKMVEGNFFRDPHVEIFVKEYSSIGISVLGEVARPGVYPSMGTRRLYDLISAAGGFSNRAGRTVTITHRDQPDMPVTVIIDSDPSKSIGSNVEVGAGDTIMVSKAGLIYVVGDVGKPGGFVMDNNERITVLQALALAQGVNRSAAMGSARIIRKTARGPEEVPIPLKQMMAAKANDMDMQPEDILFVPGSAAKNAVKRTMESVMQIATGAAIYGIH